MDSTVFHMDGEAHLYVMLPFFHVRLPFIVDEALSNSTRGLVASYHAIFNTITLVLGPPHIPPDAVLLKDIAQQQKLRGVMVIPALLEQLLHDPDGSGLLQSLEIVACTGAPLPAAVGDRIKSIVKLYMFMGSTEPFPLPEIFKSPDDWQYHEFNPSLIHEMQLYNLNEGTFELVIFADESAKDTNPLYHNVPGVSPYYTKDLFTQHTDPEKRNLFKYYGCKEDILVMANWEKVNPIPLEQHVQGHPSVKGVLLISTGRVQSALLVEPKEPEGLDEAGQAELLEKLWPRIGESNARVPGQGRVARDKDEIGRLYASAMNRAPTVKIALEAKTTYRPTAVVSFLRQVFEISFAPARTIVEDEDFFAHGLDSVQTLGITANLKRNLEGLEGQSSRSVAWISARTIFCNSTFAELSELLATFLNEGTVPARDSQAKQAHGVDEAVKRNTKGLPDRKSSKATPPRISTPW
ncbi:Uu.00g077810.m01.CDS01 [Anthostomella pinea]|uniref:Uu.00g077810.m01.CDS01 n=1 Tax=Anthostomella pinea TaxID=933095 RepID=A0AAI8VLM0_9PEZI|nr:Uu.00g077810.m01.CDS01 [Anthostomella pinea]